MSMLKRLWICRKAALALVFVGLLASVSKADNLQGQPIYAKNNTNRTIWVAARYVPPGGSDFVANGFWEVRPGERVLILHNGNRRAIYLFARDAERRVWNGNDARVTVRGETVNMFVADTTATYDPWTMNFNP